MTIGCDARCDEAHGEPSVSSSAVTAPVAPPSSVSPSAETWPQESAATATQPDSTQSSAETVQPTGDEPGDFIVIHGVKLPLAKITTKLTAMGANAVNMTLILFKDEHNDWWENYRSIRDRLISNEMGTHQLVPVQHDSLSIHGITKLLFIRVSIPRQVRGHYEVDLEGVPPRHRPAAHLSGPPRRASASARRSCCGWASSTCRRSSRTTAPPPAR
jgi:hypothetical protein